MITREHAQEQLSRAYVAAIAAKARFNLKFNPGLDYGIDGTIETVTEITDMRGSRSLTEEGAPLRFQLKSTTNCRTDATHIRYDCDARAYNRIVRQNEFGDFPTILLVVCLPNDESLWLSVTTDALTLHCACYWQYLTGLQTMHRRKRVISIPRSQLFSVDALSGIMERIQANLTP